MFLKSVDNKLLNSEKTLKFSLFCHLLKLLILIKELKALKARPLTFFFFHFFIVSNKCNNS